MFCKNCGTKLEEDAIFCMNCGVNISSTTANKYCTFCGAEREDDGIFCMNCGNRVSSNKQKESIEKVSEPPKEMKTVLNSLLEEEVESHSVEIQLKIAQCYYNGTGDTNKDYEKALQWYIKAANQDNVEAQNMLGSMYENGYGTKKNLETAKIWYKKAADRGSTFAKDSFNRLEHDTTIQQQPPYYASNFNDEEQQERIESKSKIGFVLIASAILILCAVYMIKTSNAVHSDGMVSNSEISDTFDFDSLKSDIFDYTDEWDSYEFDCYIIDEKTLNRLWNYPPHYCIYGGKKYELDNNYIDYFDTIENADEWGTAENTLKKYNVIIIWGDYDGKYYHFEGVDIRNGRDGMRLYLSME